MNAPVRLVLPRRWPSREEIRAAKAAREEAERRQDIERSALFVRYSAFMQEETEKRGVSPMINFGDFCLLVAAGKEPTV